MRLRFHGLGFACLLLLLGLLPAAAQDTTSPLLEMLAHVPDSPLTRSELYFNDRRAIEAAYPPARIPIDYTEFDSLKDTSDQPDMQPVDLWWRVFRNTSSSQMSRYLATFGTLPDVVGFDFFQIDREMNYGMPPQATLQLEGRFDLEKVRAALAAQGYVRHDESGVELWCSTDSCDAGDKVNLADRNPANPFGGELGRKQPILVAENRLLSSASLPVVELHTQALSGEAPSLADAPEYRAAADALTAEGTLIQADFLDGELLLGLTQFSPQMFLNAPADQVKQMLQDMLKDFETLPAFRLLALGDVVTETEQVGKVALVYDDADAAKTAADLIPRRITVYQSLAVKRPLLDLLEERHVTDVTAEVIKGGETGKYVVVVSLPTTKATAGQIAALTPTDPNPPDVTAPGLIYRLLLDSVYRRDMGWLMTTTREELAALAGG